MYRVSAIVTSVDEANQVAAGAGGSVITQTPDCDLILISDDDKGTKIGFR
jgi:hypothetical protein